MARTTQAKKSTSNDRPRGDFNEFRFAGLNPINKRRYITSDIWQDEQESKVVIVIDSDSVVRTKYGYAINFDSVNSCYVKTWCVGYANIDKSLCTVVLDEQYTKIHGYRGDPDMTWADIVEWSHDSQDEFKEWRFTDINK